MHLKLGPGRTWSQGYRLSASYTDASPVEKLGGQAYTLHDNSEESLLVSRPVGPYRLKPIRARTDQGHRGVGL